MQLDSEENNISACFIDILRQWWRT